MNINKNKTLKRLHNKKINCYTVIKMLTLIIYDLNTLEIITMNH